MHILIWECISKQYEKPQVVFPHSFFLRVPFPSRHWVSLSASSLSAFTISKLKILEFLVLVSILFPLINTLDSPRSVSLFSEFLYSSLNPQVFSPSKYLMLTLLLFFHDFSWPYSQNIFVLFSFLFISGPTHTKHWISNALSLISFLSTP